MEGNLIVISEGDMHMLKYLRANRVCPKSFVTNCGKFKELKPYINDDDTLLVIIKGFTDFTISEIYSLMNDIETVKEKLRNVVVVSNIGLGNVPFEYYLYEGDLFYGTMKHVIGGKVFDLDVDEENSNIDIDTSKKKRKKKNSSNTVVKKVTVNPVMLTFKEFNDKSLKVSYYGSEEVKIRPYDNISSDERRIINVDLFK